MLFCSYQLSACGPFLSSVKSPWPIFRFSKESKGEMESYTFTFWRLRICCSFYLLLVISSCFRSGGRIFFSRVNFLCWLLFWYPVHPCDTAVACKRSRSFCQKCRWQFTAKHAYTLHMWLCMKWHGAWLYSVHRMCWDSSSFVWHQPCQHCKYTTSVNIQKRTIKS